MADLVTPNNCPIKGKETGTCMCSRMMCSEVKSDHCFWMRSAFTYGFTLAEDRALERLDRIHKRIDEAFPRDGEQE